MAPWNRVWSEAGCGLVLVAPGLDTPQRVAEVLAAMARAGGLQVTAAQALPNAKAVLAGKPGGIAIDKAKLNVMRHPTMENTGTFTINVLGKAADPDSNRPRIESAVPALMFEVSANELPLDHMEKVGAIVEIYRAAIDEAQPTFAIIDHFRKSIMETTDADLQTRAWGITVYGREAVKALWPQSKNTTAWWSEPLIWGGHWFQLAENPFTVSRQAKNAFGKSMALHASSWPEPVLLRKR